MLYDYALSWATRRFGIEGSGGVIQAGIVGATGFTGVVLTELLWAHPEVRLGPLTSSNYVGQGVGDAFPHVRVPGTYVEYSPEVVADCDFVFVCYPHAASHPVVGELIDRGHRVIDLSADFRLVDEDAYRHWYGFQHGRADLVPKAVYGLPELHRERIAAADLVANPGCYPTAAILAALPLIRGLDIATVVVDAKSGVSGAGRSPSAATHFSRVHDDFRAYGEVGHRHTSEMLQELRQVAGRPVGVSFTPHLLPVDRGILATVYCFPAADSGLVSQDALTRLYEEAYANEPFVEVVAPTPALSEVQRTNYCRISPRVDEAAGLYKVVSVIDNLLKGASGQAVQNLNIMADFPEALGLGGQG